MITQDYFMRRAIFGVIGERDSPSGTADRPQSGGASPGRGPVATNGSELLDQSLQDPS